MTKFILLRLIYFHKNIKLNFNLIMGNCFFLNNSKKQFKVNPKIDNSLEKTNNKNEEKTNNINEMLENDSNEDEEVYHIDTVDNSKFKGEVIEIDRNENFKEMVILETEELKSNDDKEVYRIDNANNSNFKGEVVEMKKNENFKEFVLLKKDETSISNDIEKINGVILSDENTNNSA